MSKNLPEWVWHKRKPIDLKADEQKLCNLSNRGDGLSGRYRSQNKNNQWLKDLCIRLTYEMDKGKNSSEQVYTHTHTYTYVFAYFYIQIGKKVHIYKKTNVFLLKIYENWWKCKMKFITYVGINYSNNYQKKGGTGK